MGLTNRPLSFISVLQGIDNNHFDDDGPLFRIHMEEADETSISDINKIHEENIEGMKPILV